MISIYSKDWKSSRFQSKAIKTNQEEDLGRELLVKTVTRPSVRETANRSKINPTKPASYKYLFFKIILIVLLGTQGLK